MQTIFDLEKLLKETQSCGNGLEEANTLTLMGNLYRQNRKWNLAANSYKRSLEIYQGAKDLPCLASATVCLGTVYWEQAQLRKGMDCFERAIQILSELKNEDDLPFVQAILAISYWRQGDWKRAIALLGKILPVPWGAMPKNYQPLLDALTKAAPLLENRIPAARGSDNALRLMQAHFTLVPLYLCLEKRDEARKHLSHAESLAVQLNQENIVTTLPKLKRLLNPEN